LRGLLRVHACAGLPSSRIDSKMRGEGR